MHSTREGGMFLLGTSLAWLGAFFATSGPAPVAAMAVVLLVLSLGLIWYGRLAYSAAVDIWEFQETLMDASCQRRPIVPYLTEGSLLYVALTLEELAETLEAFGATMSRPSSAHHHLGALPSKTNMLRKLLHAESVHIRDELSRVGTFSLPMTRTEAALALDGVTDTAVTLAGLGLSSGLPVRAGYVEVAESNLSKRNPDTLKIEKDLSGKWVKGKDYRPPNLEAVLESAWPSDEELDRVTTAT